MTEQENTTNNTTDDIRDKAKTATEQFEVAGNQLVDKVKELVAEGNVRRLIFRAPDDKVMMEMTLTTGAVLGGVVALSAWWLAALGAIAALVGRIRIEVVREISEPEVVEGQATPAEPARPASTGKQKVKIEVED